MKNIFGINITNGNNNVYDGQVFHSDSAVTELGDSYKKYIRIMDNIEKKTSLSPKTKVVKYSLFMVAVAIDRIIDRGYGIEGAYHNTPVLFYIMITLFSIFFVLQIMEWAKKSYKKSDKYRQGKQYMKGVANYTKTLFKVPEEAKEIDILSFYYEIKNGKMKIVEVGLDGYQNVEFSIYVDKNNFCIVNFCNKWAIPISCITGIKKINKRISIPSWNKEVSYNKGKYKKYKIVVYLKGIFFKPYYALCLTWQGEKYELFIPPYELDVVKSVLGLK